jgi:hypothetical protein
MLALLRTIFVLEEGETLVLGAGVPQVWLAPGSQFGVERLPTRLGPVSYTITVGADGTPELSLYDGPSHYRLGF